MTPVEICFWVAAACVLYPYLIYPLLAGAGPAARPAGAARRAGAAFGFRRRRRPQRGEEHRPPARRNDGAAGRGRPGRRGDRRLRRLHGRRRPPRPAPTPTRAVRVLELPERVGKAAALSQGCAAAAHEILVFADVRQTWAADALPRMLENFADPAVGAVSGDLIVRDADGALAGVGLYWRFEKWLRRQESRLWSGVGATGGDQRRAPRAVPADPARHDPRRRLLADAGGACRATASSTTTGRTPSTACRIGRATSSAARCGRCPAASAGGAAAGRAAAVAQPGLAAVRVAQAAAAAGAVGPAGPAADQSAGAGAALPGGVRVPGRVLRRRRARACGRRPPGCGRSRRRPRSWCSTPRRGSPSGSGSRAAPSGRWVKAAYQGPGGRVRRAVLAQASRERQRPDGYAERPGR